ncbi:MAG: hypothetical protein U0231_07075 [Nitrospiraceae bacterium]
MQQPLRLLHLEDNPQDAELILSTLNEAGIRCLSKRVETRDAFLKAIRQGDIDLIMAD